MADNEGMVDLPDDVAPGDPDDAAASTQPTVETEQEPVRENRVLAAILFTDAVAFSKLAGKDEKAAFAILNRDFDLMTTICRSHGGRVLNTMGDGMMMCFGSAVEAMQCALKIQQALYTQSQTLPSISVLQHRIGVHLGDIIIDGDNVFGDGVNVAARLQAECRPGAICYSRMVADVIKNKVPIRGRFLGPRLLKNIAEPVPVYEVPSLSEYATQADPVEPLEPAPADEGASGSKAVLMVIGSVVIVLAIIILALQLRRPANETARVVPSATAPAQNASLTPDASQSPSPSPSGPTTDAQLADLRSRYDFQGMAGLLKEGSPEMTRARALTQMRAWIEDELSYTSVTHPVLLANGGKARKGTRGVIVEAPNGLNEYPLESMAPRDWLALLQGMLAVPPSGRPAPAESTTWPGIFSGLYGPGG